MHRCDLDGIPCVKFCESRNYKYECGIRNKRMTENRLIVDNKIDKWFGDRGITRHGKPLGQAIKTLEETTELLDAIKLSDVNVHDNELKDVQEEE